MHTFHANSSRRIITLYVTRAGITSVLVLLMQAKAQFLIYIDARTLQAADTFWENLTMICLWMTMTGLKHCDI